MRSSCDGEDRNRGKDDDKTGEVLGLGVEDNQGRELAVENTDVDQGTVTICPGTRMRAALGLAIIADLLQVAVFPLFVEGAASPADDVLDCFMAGVLGFLLGWHWEFLPSFMGKLVPGVDFVPFWTLAVANVYRKSKQRLPVTVEGTVVDQPSGREPRK